MPASKNEGKYAAQNGHEWVPEAFVADRYPERCGFCHEYHPRAEGGKHTPGPWVRSHHGDVFAEGGKGQRVAEVYAYTPEAREANARLIAAAPEMYEALKALSEWFNDRCNECKHTHTTDPAPDTSRTCLSCGARYHLATGWDISSGGYHCHVCRANVALAKAEGKE